MNEFKLSRVIPARTETVKFNWIRKFLTVDEVYIAVREHCGGTMLNCFWCKTKFSLGDRLFLAQRKGKTNVSLCGGCAEKAGHCESSACCPN